jgi:hypothetical protein
MVFLCGPFQGIPFKPKNKKRIWLSQRRFGYAQAPHIRAMRGMFVKCPAVVRFTWIRTHASRGVAGSVLHKSRALFLIYLCVERLCVKTTLICSGPRHKVPPALCRWAVFRPLVFVRRMPDIGAAGLSPAVAKGNLPQPGKYLFGGPVLPWMPGRNPHGVRNPALWVLIPPWLSPQCVPFFTVAFQRPLASPPTRPVPSARACHLATPPPNSLFQPPPTTHSCFQWFIIILPHNIVHVCMIFVQK